MIRRISISIILLIIKSYVFSQSIFTGNLYNENPYVYNPAYAGQYVKPSFFLAYRKVASALKGVPESINLGGSATVFRNMSLGGRFYRQTEGLFQTIIGFADYSYLLKLSKNRNLRFGISGGVNSNSLNYSDIIAEEPSEIAQLASDNFEKTYFESAAGVVFQSNQFEFSMAVPKLFSSKNDVSFSANSFMQYTFVIPESNIELKPSVFANYIENTPLLYSINLQAVWNKSFRVGAGYRNRPSLVFSAGITVNNISFSYASELSMEKYTSMFNQIHEIGISYTIPRKKSTPKKYEIEPFQQLALKEDSLTIAEEKLKPTPVEQIPIDDNETITDEKNSYESDFEIVDAGGGVYVLKPKNTDETNSDYDSVMLEKIMEPELDYLFAKQLEEMEENENVEEESDFQLKDAGSGVFVLQSTNQQDTVTKIDNAIDQDVLDSLIAKSELFEKAFSDNPEQNADGAYYHAEYYTILLFIDGAQNELLNNPEVTNLARIEIDEGGKVKYYYGYFSSREEAVRQENKLKKYDVKTKVMKFNSF